MSVTAMRKDDGDDGRAPLRAAIAEAQRARSAVDRQLEAVQRAEELVATAAERLAAATTALEDARQRHADQLAAAAATGESPAASGVLRAARAGLSDCVDELEAARTALAQLKKGGLGEVEQAAAQAENAVLVEVAKVLRPVGEELLERARRARAEFLASYQIIMALTEDDERTAPLFVDNVRSLNARDRRTEPLAALRTELFKLNLTMEDWTAAKAAAGPWLRARAALRSDPDAELPS